jgi:hypothetical protein
MIAIKPYFDDEIDSLSEQNLSKKRNKTILILSEYEVNPSPSEERIKREIKKILKSLTNHKNANKPFTGFVNAILDNFDMFVIDNESFGNILMDRDVMKMAVKEFFRS